MAVRTYKVSAMYPYKAILYRLSKYVYNKLYGIILSLNMSQFYINIQLYYFLQLASNLFMTLQDLVSVCCLLIAKVILIMPILEICLCYEYM